MTAVGKAKSTRLAVDVDAVLSFRSTPVPVWACCGEEATESVGALEASEGEEGLGRGAVAVAVAGSQSVPVIDTIHCTGSKVRKCVWCCDCAELSK